MAFAQLTYRESLRDVETSRYDDTFDVLKKEFSRWCRRRNIFDPYADFLADDRGTNEENQIRLLSFSQRKGFCCVDS